MIDEDAKSEIYKWTKKNKSIDFIQTKLLKAGHNYPQSLIESEINQASYAQHLIARSSKKSLSPWIKIPLLMFCILAYIFTPLPLPIFVTLPVFVGLLYTAWDKT